jgi:hypothetical protein
LKDISGQPSAIKQHQPSIKVINYLWQGNFGLRDKIFKETKLQLDSSFTVHLKRLNLN